MAQESSDLASQRRLLQSLGFGFIEVPFEPRTDSPAQAAGAPQRVPSPPAAAGPKSRTALPPRTAVPVAPTSPAAAIPADKAGRQAALIEHETSMRGCDRCNLQLVRGQVVPGAGLVDSRLFVIAEVPLAADDAEGSSLNGPIGEMTRKIFAAMKLTPEQVYFTTAVKCRPPEGRPPSTIERRACQPFLARQLQLVQPEVIVTCGSEALAAILPAKAADGLDRVRGRWLEWQRIPVMPTLSLELIHGDQSLKRVVWGDMQAVMKQLGIG
ncbi:hypothetical protein GC173_12075 [bacterium]|nr:hypothetical protein [bacterium]